MKEESICRGDIYYYDFGENFGSVQSGERPVLIVQNDVGNKYSPTVIVAAITSQINKAKLPTHIELDSLLYNLPKDSVCLLEQIRTLDKQRLQQKISSINDQKMKEIEIVEPIVTIRSRMKPADLPQLEMLAEELLR